MQCNKVDAENEVCSICAIGWFMNEEGKCSRNTGNVTTIDVPLGGEEGTDPEESETNEQTPNTDPE